MKFQSLSVKPIWGMSGVQNFFGGGYPFHWMYQALFRKRFTFEDVLFVAKTTTLKPNQGNMPMETDGVTPRELRPKCIVCGPWQFLMGVMLNAVGLSGPGAEQLLRRNSWQDREDGPFMISFMSITKGADEVESVRLHLEEFKEFVKLLAEQKFKSRMILQINVTCPNVGATQQSKARFLQECQGYLALTEQYLPGILVIFKVNVYTDIDTLVKLSSHPQFAGVCVSNTLPWATLTRWQQIRYFPSSIFTGRSPLYQFGGGGLSGRPLLPLVEDWVRRARRAGFEDHINAGGGILHPKDVNRLRKAGADSVSIGSVATLRPWRLRAIIDRAYDLFGSTTY